MHVRFEIDAQAVRQTVEIGEQRGHLNDVADRGVVESILPQKLDIGPAGLSRRQGQLGDEIQDGPVARRDLGAAVIALDRRDQFVGTCRALNLSPEVLAVGLGSVMAAVQARDRGCDHLALSSTEGRVFRAHDLEIQARRGT